MPEAHREAEGQEEAQALLSRGAARAPGGDALVLPRLLEEVVCWGGNGWGQLGDGRCARHRARAERVDLPGPARWIATSTTATCASLEGGETWCWGTTSKDAGRVQGEKCSGGLFGPTRICISTPTRMDLPKTAVPIAKLQMP